MMSVEETTRRVHGQLVASDQRLSAADTDVIRACVRETAPLLSAAEVVDVANRVAQQLFGLGPLEDLLANPSVTEVMVNGPGKVWIEVDGRLVPAPVEVDDSMLRVIIDRIVSPLGLRVDRTQPFVDARLVDGSRVNIAVPPLAIDGPYLTIRRFREQAHTLGDFCDAGVEAVLLEAVATRASIVVSGGTGSGKTSLLNALAAHIDPGERVITIEDAAELRLPGDHTVRLEARPPNAEGVGGVSVRALVRNALRMRPDRLIMGEVRGSEALDMVQAMNTGHDGSMATCHANSALDALRRIESMVLMAEIGLPIDAVRDHIAAAIDLVIHVERADGGSRRVTAAYSCGAPSRWLVQDGAPTDVVAYG